jgi:hypothetical protein
MELSYCVAVIFIIVLFIIYISRALGVKVGTAPFYIERRPSTFEPMFSHFTAEPIHYDSVDPLITGNLYRHRDYTRDIYSQRTSHGGWGLSEYRSDGGPGQVGVDIGPYGLAEYYGRSDGHDDGIPAEWRMPSTPVRWYAPRQRDYYGSEGPTLYSKNLYSLTEPDHDPLM